MLKASVLLPAGNGKFPDPILVEDYQDIQREVGGLFTTVGVAGTINDRKVNLIGFAPDDVPNPDNQTINWFASALFGTEMHGPCVVAWGLSPNGEYDGDIYDMPDFISEYIFGEFTHHVVSAYGEARMVDSMFASAVEAGILTESDFNDLMDYIEDLSNGSTDDYTDAQRVRFMLLLNAVEGFILGRAAEEMGE